MKVAVEHWKGSRFPPRKWQSEALPEIIKYLRSGKTPVVSAIMGAGKSYLIAELCWVASHNLKPNQKIIVTAPRQNLVAQLAATISDRCGEEDVGMYYTYAKQLDKRIIVTCNASALYLSSNLPDHKVAMLIGDEVHSTESDNFKVAYKQLSPACTVGFTATPYRSNKNETITLFDCVAYRYSAKDALTDGVIVPPVIKHWNGLHAKSSQVDKICSDMIQMHCVGPGIVSALDIDDAESYADYLKNVGFKAEAIHSKIGKAKQANLIKRLREGDLDMLVHVSLLCEGVDMPWLKWMCLRRPVNARVRFVQEVGRVLRCHPGKEHAILLDPHDLFSIHGLNNPESLGEALVVDPDEEELASLVKDKVMREKIKKMPPAKAVGHLESWVKRLLTTMLAAGICKPKKRDWNYDPSTLSTQKQRDTVLRERRASRFLPEYVRGDFKMLLHEDKLVGFKATMVSDILQILYGLKSSASGYSIRRTWWHFPNIPLPRLSAPVAGLLFRASKFEDLNKSI